MKHMVTKTLLAVTLISLVFTQCSKDERDINMNLTEVTNLFTPVDNESILLKPASGQTVVFEWE